VSQQHKNKVLFVYLSVVSLGAQYATAQVVYLAYRTCSGGVMQAAASKDG